MAGPRGAGGVVQQQQQQGQGPMVLIARPLPRVLLLHTGGTLGMDASESYEQSLDGHMVLKQASWAAPACLLAGAGGWGRQAGVRLLTGGSAAAELCLLLSLLAVVSALSR